MTKKLEKFAELKPFFNPDLGNENIIHFKLGDKDLFLRLEVNANKDGEMVIADSSYHLSGTPHALVDAFFALIEGRAIEIIDRVNIKELDYFLRDDPQLPSFEKYDDFLFQLISLGEYLKKKISGKSLKEEVIFDRKIHGRFELMSLSEKFEILEEILARYIYPFDSSLEGKVDLVDIKNNVIEIAVSVPLEEHLLEELKRKVLETIDSDYEIRISSQA